MRSTNVPRNDGSYMIWNLLLIATKKPISSNLVHRQIYPITIQTSFISRTRTVSSPPHPLYQFSPRQTRSLPNSIPQLLAFAFAKTYCIKLRRHNPSHRPLPALNSYFLPSSPILHLRNPYPTTSPLLSEVSDMLRVVWHRQCSRGF